MTDLFQIAFLGRALAPLLNVRPGGKAPEQPSDTAMQPAPCFSDFSPPLENLSQSASMTCLFVPTATQDEAQGLLERRIAALEEKVRNLKGHELESGVERLTFLEEIRENSKQLDAVDTRRPGIATLVEETRSELLTASQRDDREGLEAAREKLAKLLQYDKHQKRMDKLVAAVRGEYPKETSLSFYLGDSENPGPDAERWLSPFEPSLAHLASLPIVTTYQKMGASGDPEDLETAAWLHALVSEIRRDGSLYLDAVALHALAAQGESPDFPEGATNFDELEKLAVHLKNNASSPHLRRLSILIEDTRASAAHEARKDFSVWLEKDLTDSVSGMETAAKLYAVSQSAPETMAEAASPTQARDFLLGRARAYRLFLEKSLEHKERSKAVANGLLFQGVSKDESEIAEKIKAIRTFMTDLESVPTEGAHKNPKAAFWTAFKGAAAAMLRTENEHVRENLSSTLTTLGARYQALDLDGNVVQKLRSRLESLDTAQSSLKSIISEYKAVSKEAKNLFVLGVVEARIKSFRGARLVDTELLTTAYQDLNARLRSEGFTQTHLESFIRLERSSARTVLAEDEERTKPLKLMAGVAVVLVASEIAGVAAAIAAPFLEGSSVASEALFALNVGVFTFAHEGIELAAYGWETRLDNGAAAYGLKIGETALLNAGMMKFIGAGVELGGGAAKSPLGRLAGEFGGAAAWTGVHVTYETSKKGLGGDAVFANILNATEGMPAFLLACKAMHHLPPLRDVRLKVMEWHTERVIDARLSNLFEESASSFETNTAKLDHFLKTGEGSLPEIVSNLERSLKNQRMVIEEIAARPQSGLEASEFLGASGELLADFMNLRRAQSITEAMLTMGLTPAEGPRTFFFDKARSADMHGLARLIPGTSVETAPNGLITLRLSSEPNQPIRLIPKTKAAPRLLAAASSKP